MGLFGDILEAAGEVVGTVAGIAVAPLAIALGCSEKLIKAAIRSGCRTEREIREWVKENG